MLGPGFEKQWAVASGRWPVDPMAAILPLAVLLALAGAPQASAQVNAPVAPRAALVTAVQEPDYAQARENAPQEAQRANYSHARIVRLSFVQGEVQIARPEDEGWNEALVNMPIQQGYAIATGRGRAEIEFESGATVRLDERTEIQFNELALAEGNRITQMTLQIGSAIFYANLAKNDTFTVMTPGVQVTIPRNSRFRMDVTEKHVNVAVLKGDLTVEGRAGAYKLAKGQALLFRATDADNVHIARLGDADEFERWAAERDDALNASRADSLRYVNAPFRYGVSDLGRYGNWTYVSTYGYVWQPYGMAYDWAPYYHGRWIFTHGYGWTWVSYEPWGWLPYHYGRWAHTHRGWVWVPGYFHSWHPGLVVWLNFGNRYGWCALSPFDRPGRWHNTQINNTIIINTGTAIAQGRGQHQRFNGRGRTDLQAVGNIQTNANAFGDRLTLQRETRAAGRGLQAGASGNVSPATGVAYSGRATNPRLRETDDLRTGAPAGFATRREGLPAQGRAVGQASGSVPGSGPAAISPGAGSVGAGRGGRATDPRPVGPVREIDDTRTGAPAGAPARGTREGRPRFDNDNVTAAGASTGTAGSAAVGGTTSSATGRDPEVNRPTRTFDRESPATRGGHAGEGPSSIEYDRNDRRYVNTPSMQAGSAGGSAAGSGAAAVRPPSRAYDPPEADAGRSLPPARAQSGSNSQAGSSPARTYGGDRDSGASRVYTPPARTEGPPPRVYTPPARNDSPPPRTYSPPPSSGGSGGSAGRPSGGYGGSSGGPSAGPRPSSPPPSTGGAGRAAEPRSSSPPPARSGRPN